MLCSPQANTCQVQSVKWQKNHIEHITQGKGNIFWHDLNASITGISIDTRMLQPGELFIALKTPCPTELIQKAFEKNACAVLIASREEISMPKPILYVNDTLQALYQLAQAARQRFQGTVLALTGTFGKTSIKEWLFYVLSFQAPVVATQGNLNNHIGLPLNLANWPSDVPYGVLEMGMDHTGEIDFLVQLAHPSIVLITTIAPHYTSHFSCIENIVKAKCEIFNSPCVRTAIVPRDNPYYEMIYALGNHVLQWITFGYHAQSDIRLLSYEVTLPYAFVTVSVQNIIYTYRLFFYGEHWILNSLAVIAAAYALKMDLGKIFNALGDFQPIAGRGQTLNIAGIEVTDESYNAGPGSMKAALQAFQHKASPKYLILGEIRGLAHESAIYHDALYEPIMQTKANGVWLCGAEMQALAKKLPHVINYSPSIDDLIPSVLAKVRPGDHLLVKGSHFSRTFFVIRALYHYYGLHEEAHQYPPFNIRS